MTDESPALDADAIDAAGLPRRATPVGGDGFRVVYTPSALAGVRSHARSRTDVEVGGVLLGSKYVDDRGLPYLLVDGAIPALAATNRASHVTFTADTWVAIHDAIDRTRPGAAIVGWYHTHPGFGVFLSEMDVFIHRHFFDQPHLVALVIDPVANTSGTFVWREDALKEEPTASESPSPDDSHGRDAPPSSLASSRSTPIRLPLPHLTDLALTALLFVATYVTLSHALSLLDAPAPASTEGPAVVRPS